MTVVAKMGDKIVEVMKFAWNVQFSEDKGWLLIDPDVGAPDMTGSIRANMRWVPATTRFDWVRLFNF